MCFFFWVDAEDFEDEFLAFADVVAYVADPTCADFASVEEPFFVVVFFEGDVGAVVGDFFDCGEDEVISFWPFVFFEGGHGFVCLTPLWL